MGEEKAAIKTNVQQSLQQTQLFTHALSHSFSPTCQGAQCGIPSGPRKGKFNHSVKLTIRWENYPRGVTLHFHLSMVVMVWGSTGCWWMFLRRDSRLTGTQRCSGWWPYLLWSIPLSFIERIFAQTFFFFFWGRKKGSAEMGPSVGSLGCQRGADEDTEVRRLQGGSLEGGTSLRLPHC